MLECSGLSAVRGKGWRGFYEGVKNCVRIYGLVFV